MNDLNDLAWNLGQIRIARDASDPRGFKVIGADGAELVSRKLSDGSRFYDWSYLSLSNGKPKLRLVLETREGNREVLASN